ncbi:MAG: cyclic nucleotide-binding domain-containing protein [Panacagrimonas sp.]
MLDRPALSEFVNAARTRSYRPRQVILNAGDEPTSLFLILEGSVSVTAHEGCREMVLAYLNSGEFFGEMCLFPEQRARTAMVRARMQTLVAEMDYHSFREFAHRSPGIMFEVAGQMAARLRNTSRRLRDLAFLDVAGRMAHELLQLAAQPDAKLHPRGTLVRVSRQELGRFAGCSREMAGRVLKKLEEDGAIALIGRNILVYATEK